MVYLLQKGDPGWEATLKEVIGLHSLYIEAEHLITSHYNSDFVDFIDKAVKERKERLKEKHFDGCRNRSIKWIVRRMSIMNRFESCPLHPAFC